MPIPVTTNRRDTELSATERTSAVASRGTGRRRLNFIQRLRRAAAAALRRSADRDIARADARRRR